MHAAIAITIDNAVDVSIAADIAIDLAFNTTIIVFIDVSIAAAIVALAMLSVHSFKGFGGFNDSFGVAKLMTLDAQLSLMAIFELKSCFHGHALLY